MIRTLLCLLALTSVALAGDPTGKWAQLSAEGKAPPKAWWDHLVAGYGPCCSFADGQTVADVDWDMKDGHYRVYLHEVIISGLQIPDGWVQVPDAAVIQEPNRFGQTVIWPYITWSGDAVPHAAIRCFLRGSEG